MRLAGEESKRVELPDPAPALFDREAVTSPFSLSFRPPCFALLSRRGPGFRLAGEAIPDRLGEKALAMKS